jgi:hypothetical protein
MNIDIDRAHARDVMYFLQWMDCLHGLDQARLAIVEDRLARILSKIRKEAAQTVSEAAVEATRLFLMDERQRLVGGSEN